MTWTAHSPPGGAYVPPATTAPVANPTVYTTTAIPALPTPPGTISNCGLYYNTQSGDYCNMIAMNFSITFDQLRAMNPQIDANCSNLWANASYCVAPVNGTTITPAPITSTTSTASSPTGTLLPPTTTTTTTKPAVTVAPPAPTQPGATSQCYEWYVAADGDYCYLVYTKFGITFDQLRAWNPYLDENCSNMWPGYAYCVKGP